MSGANKEELYVTIETGGRRDFTDDDAEPPTVCLRVPNRLLYRWHSGCKEGTTFIEQLNDSIHDGVVTVDIHCQRLEGRLARQAGSIKSHVLKLKGGAARMNFLDKKASFFNVFRGETISAGQVLDELEETVEDASEWMSRYKYSEAVVRKLRETISSHIATSTSQQPEHSALLNPGQSIGDLSTRQQRRKLSQLKTSAEKALWFVDSFGLDLISLTLADPSQPEKPVDLIFTDTPTQKDCSVYQILFLLERFGVSDEFYHELSMVSTSLPRSHQIKTARKHISETIDIKRLPLPYQGAYRPFKASLAATLAHEFQKKCIVPSEPVAVKLSGDGAQFSKTSTFILLSYSLPGLADDVLSGHGNHTFAAIKGSENYDFIRSAMEPVLNELNAVIASSKIVVNGAEIALEFFLGSDYKFLLLMMGMNAAHSNYSCIWCSVHKDKRWDMSVPINEYCTKHSRTLSSIKHCAQLPLNSKPNQRLGCVSLPLLDIEPSCIVIDELHLLLRISDRLIENIVVHTAGLDNHARVHKLGLANNLMTLQKTIHRSCSIHFKVWAGKDADGRACQGKYEWTALNGQDRLKLLHKLPPHIPDIVGGEASSQYQQVWENFLSVYQLLTKTTTTTTEECDHLHQKAKDWVKLFVSLGKHYEGFQMKRVTPYMHILVYHVPQMMKKLGGIKKFSGQGVEKNNDDGKRNYYSSNKHDAAADILRTEARLEVLARGTETIPKCVREKRQYLKRNDGYWKEGGIIAARSKRIHTDTDIHVS